MKNKYLEAIDKLEDEYDAYYMGNKYGVENTHKEQFELLKNLDGDKVENALAWIQNCYDCYYKNELPEDSAFSYLRECANKQGAD